MTFEGTMVYAFSCPIVAIVLFLVCRPVCIVSNHGDCTVDIGSGVGLCSFQELEKQKGGDE